ncbi:MAG TPA: protein-disulfide reductase DsbD domain-containing protein [Xanthobacteraceae bacterium]|nr:protein-disulfide reductase DsbD domain-containing protein [Xanthobacteraceae bacterium]
MRLIAGGPPQARNAPLRAGVEVKLAPGWKTYWRYPGDSGVPPRFDFAGSDNVKSVTIGWPAPHRFTDESGSSIGYKTEVIFPLRIMPQDPARPVRLHLNLDYAVCEKLCVPAEGSAELALDGAASRFADALAAAEATVPKPARIGDAAPLAVRSVHREGDGAHPHIVVDVVAPPGPVDLFAEGPTPEWALPLPEPTQAAKDGSRRFIFVLDGLPPGASPHGAALKLTLVAGANAVEVPAPLD